MRRHILSSGLPAACLALSAAAFSTDAFAAYDYAYQNYQLQLRQIEANGRALQEAMRNTPSYSWDQISAFELRLGAFGGAALSSNATYGSGQDDSMLMGRGGMRLSFGYVFSAGWGDTDIGMGVYVTQQLGTAWYSGDQSDLNDDGIPFVGATTADLTLDVYTTSYKVRLYMLFGIGVAYSDGDSFEDAGKKGYKPPLYYNDDLNSGPALLIRLGLGLDILLTEHVGLGFRFDYEAGLDTAEKFVYGDIYNEKSYDYSNTIHNWTQSVELLFRF